MDAREIEVVGIILNLQVKLAKYPDIDMLMDVVVIDVLDNWGMLLQKMGRNSWWVHSNGLDICYYTCIRKH